MTLLVFSNARISSAWLDLRDEQPHELETPVHPQFVSEHVSVHDHSGETPPGLLGYALHEVGPIRAEYVYTGECYTNTRGGIRSHGATRYLGLFQLALALDLDKAGLFPGGKFIILGENIHGQGLTNEIVGDFQTLSNIDAPARMQVGEYWWEKSFYDELLTVRIGKQDVNSEFLVVDLAADFIQSSFGLSPSLGVPTYPDTSFAAVALAQLTDSIEMKLGIWDGVPDGTNWGFSGSGITLTIAELEHRWKLADDMFPGALDAGIGYVSGGTVDGFRQPQSWAWYAQLEQIVYHESRESEDEPQGLGFFLQYSSSYDEPDVLLPEHFGVGLVYRGLVPTRDNDTLGLGMARALLNFGGTGRENAVELFYKMQISEHAMVQPEMQYIVSPSGLYPDALVAGLRFELVL
jgi:porin